MRLFFKRDHYDSGVGLFFHEADTDTSKTMICVVCLYFVLLNYPYTVYKII